MNFIGALVCSITLTFAAVLVEWFHATPDYFNAAEIVWHQTVAIMLYYFIWVRPDAKQLQS